MPDASTELDGAKVVLWSHLPGESGRAAGVAVCQYTDEDGFYVFWYDAYWKVISDTAHHSVDDATDAIFQLHGEIGARLWQQSQSPKSPFV